MNQTSAGTLTPYEFATIREEVRGLLNDSETSVSVTWCPRTGRVYDPAAGTITHTEQAVQISAYAAPVDLTEIEGARVGDVKLLFTAGSVTTAPAVDDRWVEASGVAWAVYHVVTDAWKIHYTVYGRKVA